MGTLELRLVRTDTTQPWVVGPPWVKYPDRRMFSFEDQQILKDSNLEIESMPGHYTTNSEIIDDYTFKLTLIFETLKDAQDAADAFRNPKPGSMMEKRIQVVKNKRQELGIQYNFIIEVF